MDSIDDFSIVNFSSILQKFIPQKDVKFSIIFTIPPSLLALPLLNLVLIVWVDIGCIYIFCKENNSLDITLGYKLPFFGLEMVAESFVCVT